MKKIDDVQDHGKEGTKIKTWVSWSGECEEDKGFGENVRQACIKGSAA
jgi:hypothetical protein